MRRFLFRNIRARDHLEIFLVSAVSSLLLLRFILYLTDYPQAGGKHLHIAHMLYGGLFMMVAIVMQLSFLGARIQRFCALLGGIGFGIFIDELGKFLTKDNNYFFRPTIGLIYAIFIILYLIFNFLGRSTRLTTREYELNALVQFEEAILDNLDTLEKARIHRLLKRADPHDPVVQALQKLLEHIDTVPAPPPQLFRKAIRLVSKTYHRFWRNRRASGVVGAFFLVEAAIFLVAVLANLIHNFDSLTAFFQSSDGYAKHLIVGQLASTLVAGGFAIAGAIKLASSRSAAFELFRRATLINLLLTEFFIFSRIQFGAIPGFLVNLALLLALRYAIHEERRNQPASI